MTDSMSHLASASVPLNSKTCLVTGGAGGLGKYLARGFLQAGATVVICDRNKEALAQTTTELSKLGSVMGFAADVSKQGDVQQLFDDITSKLGSIDVLVNNAGITDGNTPVGDCDPDWWDRVIAVNLTGPMLVSRLAIKSMLQKPSPGGCIINIASISSVAGYMAGAAYTASKHGLIGLTKNIAGFYGRDGISCIALQMGGVVGTDIQASMWGEMHARGAQQVMEKVAICSKTYCDPEAVAQLCVNIAQDGQSRLLNGSCMSSDNGFMCELA
ncbi:uncharacterized protein PpBr36_10647 [Pyricularia pennisetigena]|uniref:uncharacterized protein n=1 Tax=Pyricularia pennisetigena TaxID=1578925 RepID=UPI001152AA97|nr:uncharacterized protein PpBr36_10647 [Pyricularia pennisetigena]TLS21075.1 hypothetical protein PpBr36_10647 [Pyricularia pennisetigena]